MNLNEQLRLKIILEERFRREVRALFNRIRIQYRVGISTETRIRASRYVPQWVVLLQRHYTRVQRVFRGVVQNDHKQAGDTKQTDDEVIAALLAWADENSQEVAAVITNTTQENMDSALMQARQSFSDQGITDYSTRELALVAAVMLGRVFRGRETSIIMTETQRAAESTKLIEAYSLSGLQPMAAVTREQTPSTESSKDWIDVGDKDVRDGHHAREVAEVDVNQPFIVNGQQMMYPGDNSRGASVDNTINCRCGSFYTFREQGARI